MVFRYHVPRSFLNDGDNELVLFEEFGGNPSQVTFQTVTVGTTCGNAYENTVLEISCQGRPISDIKFASFGNPEGTCGSFQKGTCDANNDPLLVVREACVGKASCSFAASGTLLGPTNCDASVTKRLVVEAVC